MKTVVLTMWIEHTVVLDQSMNLLMWAKMLVLGATHFYQKILGFVRFFVFHA